MFCFKKTNEEQGRWENFFGDNLILNPTPSPCLQATCRGSGPQETRGRTEGRGEGSSQLTLFPPPSSSSSAGDGDELAPPLKHHRKPVSLGSSSVSGPHSLFSPTLPLFFFLLSSLTSPLSFIADYSSLTLLSSHHRLSGTITLLSSPLFLCIQQTPLQAVVVDLR